LSLPNLKNQCIAPNRKVLSGEDHPNYKHGERTLEALSKYRQKVAELDELERLGHKYGFMEGSKRRGRKPVGE